MRRLLPASLSLLVALLAAAPPGRAEGERAACIPGIGPVDGVHKLATGFTYTEGPTVDEAGNLYFSDPRDGPGRIWRLDPQGGLLLLVPNSNRSNGLRVSREGELVVCEMETGRVVTRGLDGSFHRVLAAEFNGRRFNVPNDVAIDQQGGIYFTDPSFDRPSIVRRPQGKTSVYYIAPTGEVRRVVEHVLSPNGIALSPDQSTLFVTLTVPGEVMAYPVRSPGCLGEGEVFARLGPGWSPFSLADGCAVDRLGNLYVCTRRGVQVFDRTGRRLGIIPLPERAVNLVFGGPDGRTLYIAAATSIYVARMLVPGVQYEA